MSQGNQTSERVEWAYYPVCSPHRATSWRVTVVTTDFRRVERRGFASSPRRARRAIRKAVKDAQKGKP